MHNCDSDSYNAESSVVRQSNIYGHGLSVVFFRQHR